MNILFNILFSVIVIIATNIKAMEEQLVQERGAFYFVRHGITLWDLKDVKKGPQNLELSDKGREDIINLSSIFLKVRQSETDIPTNICYSPLIRCKQTMEILKDKLSIGTTVEVKNLKEVYRGDWSRLEDSVIEEALELFKVKNYPDLENKIPDTEKLVDFNRRVLEAISGCLQGEMKCPILVTHGQVVESFLKQKGCWSEELETKWIGDTRPPIKVTYYGEIWTAELMG